MLRSHYNIYSQIESYFMENFVSTSSCTAQITLRINFRGPHFRDSLNLLEKKQRSEETYLKFHLPIYHQKIWHNFSESLHFWRALDLKPELIN